MAEGNDDLTEGTDGKDRPTSGVTNGPTGGRSETGRETTTSVSRRQLLQVGAAGALSALAIGAVTGDASDHPNTIVFDGTGSPGKSTYEFEVSGEIEPHSDAGPVEVKDTIDGSYATGAVHRDRDAYRFSGQLTALDVTGNAAVSVTYGDEGDIEADRLEIVAESGASIDYSFTTSDKVVAVTDNGDNSAEDDDGVVENSDGTWTADGSTADGSGDTFDFWGDVTDFGPMEGSYTLFLNGTEVSAYDLTGEEPPDDREHSYSFENVGNEWADYYLEVEDGGDMVASTLEGAVIEPDFHWISEDGTKAAGRVDPGERHAYEFDNLVLDVTIEGGDVDAYVDGNSSNLDIYPLDGASGDDWKGGFPWQDEEQSDSTDGPAIGGGSGYGNTVTESDAGAVVRTSSDLTDALSAAASGDVVYVPGDETVNMGNRQYEIPDGVTLASDRGVDGSAGALLYTDDEPGDVISLNGSARLTGVRLKGPHPGDDQTGDSLAGGAQTLGAGEIDNCEIWGFSHHGIRVDTGDGAHIHHNVVQENNKSGLGYGVSAESGTPVIEYNYFNYNRHSVASSGDHPGYVVRYNHFGPDSTGGVIDMHDPTGVDSEVHNNVVEAVVSTSGHRDPLQSIQIRGTPDDAYDAHDNWFWNELPPRDSPSGWTNEAIIQATESTWKNIGFWDNHYGENAGVTYSDIIPGYDGHRS